MKDSVRSGGLRASSLVLAMALLGGCRPPAVTFPASSMQDQARQAGAVAAYDTDHNGRADFFHFASPAGVVDRLGYDCNADGQVDEQIDLTAMDNRRCRHLVIILDGFSYDIIQQYRGQGGLAALGPPSLVIAPYPTMTDACLEDVLNYMPCQGFEAKFYNRRTGRMDGGKLAYLEGFNQPYDALLNYRANLIWDVLGYVAPRPVFHREINHLKRAFDRLQSQEMLAYIVSSAGMGTRYGAQGQLECLRDVDRLVNQVMCQTRGLTRVTLLSDHGHSYTKASRLDLEGYLAAKGWRVVRKLKGDGSKEVVPVPFGLVNYASLNSPRRADLAADLAQNPHILLASCVEGDQVVVLAGGGQKAIITRRGDRYGYGVVSGDPLQLAGIVKGLQADQDGFYDDQEVLAATADHVYPDPLHRLWRAHLGLVQNPPDVIVSLEESYYYGLHSLAKRVEVESTHGSLQRGPSRAFIMTSAGPLPPLMRSDQVPAAMAKLFTWPWPARR